LDLSSSILFLDYSALSEASLALYSASWRAFEAYYFSVVLLESARRLERFIYSNYMASVEERAPIRSNTATLYFILFNSIKYNYDRENK
jgi:hypothetical protein